MEAYYRKNAAAVVFNRDGKVLMCIRADKHDNTMQFPQGGIEHGESPVEASTRELREETGLRSVVLVANIEKPIRYSFTPDILERFKKINRKDLGQDQYWSLFFFTGNEDEIDFKTHLEEVEFKDCRWVDLRDAPNFVVGFKKEAYQEMVDEFEPILKDYIKSLALSS